MRSTALLVTFIIAGLAVCSGSGASPLIVVYTGGMDEFATMLAGLIEEEDSISAEVLILASPEEVRYASAMPNMGCILMFTDHKDELIGLDGTLSGFFQAGGGLVGMTEVCNMASAGKLATEVFPVHGNFTAKPAPGRRRACTYVLSDDLEIAEGLPDTFDILTLGLYISADSDGNPLEIAGDHAVVFDDLETGSPLVIAHQSEMGGRSVAMPGIMVVASKRVDVYYGNLFLDHNFTTLLVNSVAWAMGNSRLASVGEEIEGKLDEWKALQEDLEAKAEAADKERSTSRTVKLIAAWTAGMAACALIVFKMVLPVQE